MKYAWLTKEISIPTYTLKDIIFIAFAILIPNVVFLALAAYTHTSRPIVNLDYMAVILILLIPYKVIRAFGIALLIVVILFDFLMFTIQIFPFLNLAAIEYLIPFLTIAPTPYIAAIGIATGYILVFSYVFPKLTTKVNRFYCFIAIIIMALIGLQTISLKYHQFQGGILGRNNYYYANSQIYLYYEITQSDFVFWSDNLPKLSPYPPEKHRASDQLSSPASNKILFIIAESWGVARQQEAQNQMLEKIYQSSPNFEYINTSYFDFNGATVEGELRELCKLETSNGFALRKLDKKHFINCLPNQLKSQGYETIALHGTSGRLYDRYDWYPKAGFNQSLFGENFTSLQRCSAFNGICDSELINVVADKFSENRNNKLFFYWLTLTSHSPYVKEDITNNRFNCQQFGMKPEGDICRNAKLETQFLDNLAKLVLRPEMKGVEVVIVGDHMPPLFGNEEIYPYLRWQDVSWLHFKVKD